MPTVMGLCLCDWNVDVFDFQQQAWYIQYAVHQCARFTHIPRASYEQAVLRICYYLTGTKDKGLVFKPSAELTLDCYVDADFAGLWKVKDGQGPECVKSRTGYVLMLHGCPLTWASRLQSEIALSC